jgi:hypothetical protein
MTDIFKSTEHMLGFQNLRADYEAFTSIEGQVKTRLSEKLFDQLDEQFYDAVVECLDNDWVVSMETEFENTPSAGHIEGIFEVVDKAMEPK